MKKIYAIHAAYLEKFLEVEARLEDIATDPEAYTSFIDDNEEQDDRPYEVINGVALLSIRGKLIADGDFWSRLFGMTAYSDLGTIFSQVALDDEVEKVLISMSTPGGQVAGISDMADAWSKLNAIKPITVHSNGMITSAGYWLAVHSSKIYASSVAEVGSIGVMLTHVSQEERLKKEGIKVTEIKSASKKAVGSPAKDLTAEEKDILQARVDELSNLFKVEVYKNRPSVDEEVFSGETFLAAKAVSLGLIDGVKSYSDIFAEMVSINNNNEIGGFTMKKKVTAEMYESAVAAGADPATLEIVSQEEYDALKDESEQAAETEEQDIETEEQAVDAEEQLVDEEQAADAEAEEKVEARISELEADLATARTELEQARAKIQNLQAGAELMDQMKDHLISRMAEMRVALGLSKIDMSEFTVATVVTEYAAIEKTFKKSFKVGGVVSPQVKEEPKAEGETKITYLDRARLKAVGV